MPDTRGSDAAVQSDGRNGDHRTIVSDLVCLIEHVQASLKLVELAIAGDAPAGDQELAPAATPVSASRCTSCWTPAHRNTKAMAPPTAAASGWS